MNLCPGLPQRLQEIIDKCLIKNRDLRYQSAAEIHHDLLKLKKDYESGKSLKSVRVATTWSPQREVASGDGCCGTASSSPPRLSGDRESCDALASSGSGVRAQSASLVPERKSVAVLPFADSRGRSEDVRLRQRLAGRCRREALAVERQS